MSTKNLIGERIRTLRLNRKMTQADLATAIGQSQSSITMYETGRREPDFETLEALADVFNVPLASLVSDDSVPHSSSDPLLNDDIRVLVGWLNKCSPDQVAQVKNVFRAMYLQTNPELFEKGDDDE